MRTCFCEHASKVTKNLAETRRMVSLLQQKLSLTGCIHTFTFKFIIKTSSNEFQANSKMHMWKNPRRTQVRQEEALTAQILARESRTDQEWRRRWINFTLFLILCKWQCFIITKCTEPHIRGNTYLAVQILQKSNYALECTNEPFCFQSYPRRTPWGGGKEKLLADAYVRTLWRKTCIVKIWELVRG